MDKELIDFLQGIENRINTTMQDGFKKVEAKIENEVSTKISALFDGHAQLDQKTDRIEKAVNEISEKVNNQEVEIRVLKAVK